MENLDKYRILGEFTGFCEGLLHWDIPEELKGKIQQQLKILKGYDKNHCELCNDTGYYHCGIYEGEPCKECNIDDGFGNIWSAYCPKCNKKTMVVIRPGKAQCMECG